MLTATDKKTVKSHKKMILLSITLNCLGDAMVAKPLPYPQCRPSRDVSID